MRATWAVAGLALVTRGRPTAGSPDDVGVEVVSAPESAAVLAKKLAQRTRERDESADKLKRLTTAAELTVADITALIDQLGGIVKALNHATAEERAELYEALALKLTYEPEPRLVRVDVDQARKDWMCPRGDLDHNPTVVLQTELGLR